MTIAITGRLHTFHLLKTRLRPERTYNKKELCRENRDLMSELYSISVYKHNICARTCTCAQKHTNFNSQEQCKILCTAKKPVQF